MLASERLQLGVWLQARSQKRANNLRWVRGLSRTVHQSGDELEVRISK